MLEAHSSYGPTHPMEGSSVVSLLPEPHEGKLTLANSPYGNRARSTGWSMATRQIPLCLCTHLKALGEEEPKKLGELVPVSCNFQHIPVLQSRLFKMAGVKSPYYRTHIG